MSTIIPMKDERLPTPTIAGPRPEPTADELRVILGERVRAARTAKGMSQQALADAMSQHGFSWRQTTVAKVEAADRPTLFTEVVALGRIFHKDLTFFFTPRTDLDDLAEELNKELDTLRGRVEDSRRGLSYMEVHLAIRALETGLALAIQAFRHHGDSGELKNSLDIFASAKVFNLNTLSRVLDAAGVPQVEVEAADYAALREAAAATLADAGEMSVHEVQENFTGEELLQASTFLEGGQIDIDYIESLRDDEVWRTFFAQILLDLLVEYSSR